MRASARLFSAAVMLGALMAVPASARADDVDACAASYESAQRLRSVGKLRSALEAAITCSRVCPGSFKKECTEWLGSLRDAVPSLSVRVLGPDGCDVADARVTMSDPNAIDTAVTDGRGDGRAFDVDPGNLVMTARLASGAERRLPLVVAQGGRDRAVVVSFAEAGAVCGSAQPNPPVAPRREQRKVPAATWLFGGLGIASLFVSAGFGVAGLSKMSDLSSCRPRCAHDEADSMRGRFLVADIALASGVVSLAAAAVFYLVAPARPPSSSLVRDPTPLLSF